MLVMRHTVRGLVIELTANLKKLEHVADYIVIFMILPERAKMGMIEKLDHLGFPRAGMQTSQTTTKKKLICYCSFDAGGTLHTYS